MKYALFIVAALVLISTACKKKVDRKNCYTCTDNDSLASNIPSLINPHYYRHEGNHCEYTDWMKELYIKQHTFVDTLYTKGDTVALRYHTTDCVLY